jgi:pyruvate kinase
MTFDRKAKIIATIGPASSSDDRIRALIKAGMNVARLNFSHGKLAEHTRVLQEIRKAASELDRSVGIMQDLRGPKLRTAPIAEDGSIELRKGERVVVATDQDYSTSERICVNYPGLIQDVEPGSLILLDDGRMTLEVLAVGETEIQTEVTAGGELKSRKGVNLPNTAISLPSLTSKDKRDLRFGIEQGVDAIAMSFVRTAQDVQTLQDAIDALAKKQSRPQVIAKLERPEAVDNLHAILRVCDGVMVARGDLGVEVSPEQVPSLQKMIIQEANQEMRYVITATQMLETMIRNPQPTRAEASDVANAVFDGTDSLMLSGETAVGQYPVRAIETMHTIIVDAESHAADWGMHVGVDADYSYDDASATTKAAKSLAQDRAVAAIAVFTRSGRTAKLMAKVRPEAPILAFTPDQSTYQQLSLFWGVRPHLVQLETEVEGMIKRVRKACLQSGAVKRGEQVVLVASLPVGAMGPPNFTLLHTIK